MGATLEARADEAREREVPCTLHRVPRRAVVAVISAFALACEGALGAPDAGTGAPRDAARADATPRDAAAPLDAPEQDAWLGADAAVADPCAAPLPRTPSRVLFVGNSFTFTANMPRTFERLVEASGFPVPEVGVRAIGGQTLEGHRADADPDGAPALVREGWDVVVLQELSTRPTDAIGDPERFKEDATWFHDLAITAEPEAQVVLYETFARRAGHPYYPATFTDPADMQAQLRFHYEDCADGYIPANSTVVMERPVIVARVGDAWERVLSAGEPPRLHGDDDYHPNDSGAYLTALVFFGTLYGRRVEGLPALGIDASFVSELQAAADAITGAERAVPAIECPRGVPVGDALAIDFGPDPAPGWATVDELGETVGPLTTAGGVLTDARVSVRGFSGTQTGGSAINDLGLPATVSADSLWVGSFDGHEAALGMRAHVALEGLSPGEYTLELFASRDGDDGGNGRLTRYAVGGRALDLEVSDNRDRAATFDAVSPDADGTLDLEVSVSPDGRARFAYAGMLRLTRRR